MVDVSSRRTGESAGSGLGLAHVWRQLHRWARERNFSGWDPYDGLNSSLVQKSPAWRFKWGRIAVTQLVKHSPLNLRPILRVEKEANPKGLGLFLSGTVEAARSLGASDLRSAIEELTRDLDGLRSRSGQGSGWGYPFPWQSRLFYLPSYTPTVVATSYVGNAFLEAHDLTGHEEYLDRADSAARFILEDLNRTYDEDGEAFCWSYSPIDDTEVYNASLLGSRLLARVYARTGEKELKEEARRSVEYVVRRQGPAGEWVYGGDDVQQWIDNFHTGFNLECLYDYVRCTGDTEYQEALEKGLEYYASQFFHPSGAPKYYANSLYPIDIHSCAQAIITLVRLRDLGGGRELAKSVLRWTLENMRNESGYFYFQKRRLYTNKTPFMRWSQAWMHRALATAIGVLD